MRISLTKHAGARSRQRGLKTKDLDIILEYGTETQDAVVLTNSDAGRAIARLKRQISQLERLRGTALFMAGEAILSVYRPNRSKLRRMLQTVPSRN